jgi:hypothetical protein
VDAPGHYRKTLLRFLRGEFARLKDPALDERVASILAAFDQAEASGVEVSPWLMGAAEQLQCELAERQAERSRLVGELDRWIEHLADSELEKN